jgi:hypothetical protein
MKTEWITRAEAGRRLGVSASMVSRYCRRGMPTRGDRRVPWPIAERWRKDNIDPQLSGSWLSRHLARNSANSNGTPSAGQMPRAMDFVEYRGYVTACCEIISPAERARFARFAQRLNCTPEQCVALSLWYSTQAVLALKSLHVSDVPGTPRWTDIGEPDWEVVLNCSVDMSAVDRMYDQESMIDIDPKLADRHDAELNRIVAGGRPR